ncbi:MAG: polyketide cyclase [Gammaproteobacteria bacterium]|nr:polyketide cyclase [Gammaproteobacteria bacterium]
MRDNTPDNTPDNADPDSTADRTFVHSRLMDAPVENVFRAIAEPQRLARWWGPAGFSSTFELFEFRPGGRWRFVMHGPDGTDYPNENVFLEITPPTRVVIEHPSEDHRFVITISLSRDGHQTRVDWRQVFDVAAHHDEIAAFVGPANEQNLDRLTAEARNVNR